MNMGWQRFIMMIERRGDESEQELIPSVRLVSYCGLIVNTKLDKKVPQFGTPSSDVGD